MSGSDLEKAVTTSRTVHLKFDLLRARELYRVGMFKDDL